MVPQPQFNLIDEDWIDVEYSDGTKRKVSLQKAFEDASDIRRIVPEFSQGIILILRFMLAVLYRCYQREGIKHGETKHVWGKIWKTGHFDVSVIGSYLQRVHDRFYLIGGDKPFMQEAGLSYQGKNSDDVDDIGRIVIDLPDNDNKFLFSLRSKGSVESLSCPEAAVWLLAIQAYDCAGIKTPLAGSTTARSGREYAPKGQISTGALGLCGGIYLERANLFETLMMNWVMYVESGEVPFLALVGDAPVWEREAISSMDRRRLTGPADLFTFTSRRVRLIPSDDGNAVTGVVIGYGAQPDPNDMARFETMTLWRLASKKQGESLGIPEGTRVPKTHDPKKALWRGLASVLPFPNSEASGQARAGVLTWVNELMMNDDDEEDDDFSDSFLPQIVAIHAQGMTYGTQNSVYEDSVDEQLDLNKALVRRDDVSALSVVLDVLKRIENCVNELANSVTRVHGLARNKTTLNRYEAFSASIRAEAYYALDALCRNYLRTIADDNAEALETQWRDEAHRLLIRLAEHYFQGTGGSWIAKRKVGGSEIAVGDLYVKLLGYFANEEFGLGKLTDFQSTDATKED
ncbi:type I-E CRISPR-associated protein Cse1/CasA [Bifidobacterium boum]|uniref:CRISPR-associated protein, Cse1 family n=1 Tax=Bifidobacterium boum TaxID=78343 RepID=A0A086ZPN0_9BIFI|nr:type I-E CRISPR-associated protein Cse1/CasA [Bifidobacterium boum]KFI48480.1 CRISPR-associated protein, Cse1 family [Bifidobacterium boum]